MLQVSYTMCVGVSLLKVECTELMMYTINSKATTNIAQQRAIANNPTRDKENQKNKPN